MKIRRILVRIVASFLLLALGLVLLSVASNVFEPNRSSITDRLTGAEKARLAEALHLRQALGGSIWPGWGEADIPVILYNEEYAFLVRYPHPPVGWAKIPQNLSRGDRWELVPNDTFEDRVYYRQRLKPGIAPEAFTVLVGEQWVASLPTCEWFLISLGEPLRSDFGALFPYRLAARMLVGSSDKYISLVLHESFHAYQGMTAPEHLAQAEQALVHEKECSWDDQRQRAAWRRELNLLAEAVSAHTDQEVRSLVLDFLAERDARRQNSSLSLQCVGLEQQREWLEGLAKYTELTMWRQAAAIETYQPLTILSSDPDFKRYGEAEERWSQEVNQIKLAGNELKDVSFYYSGMAEAALVERLMPGSLQRALKEETDLEDLLRGIKE